MGRIYPSAYQLYVCSLIRENLGCAFGRSSFCKAHGGCFIYSTKTFAEAQKNYWRCRKVIWPALQKELKKGGEERV